MVVNAYFVCKGFGSLGIGRDCLHDSHETRDVETQLGKAAMHFVLHVCDQYNKITYSEYLFKNGGETCYDNVRTYVCSVKHVRTYPVRPGSGLG